jgi:hypothetical protein
MKGKPSWYGSLEPPIRGVVKLLRDNGWNTTCSCGHGMWVELDIYTYMDDLEALRNLLIENGYKDFTIKADMRVQDLWPIRRAVIYLGNFVPADNTSSKELTAKIADLKETAERLNQENYRLRERLNKRVR